jgi:hypothetical protein
MRLILLVAVAFWLGFSARKIRIGSYDYALAYANNTLGKTEFPLDDRYGQRRIVLPVLRDQQPVSLLHEEIHACLHNHDHRFSSVKELDAHLNQSYTEEQIATTLAPCLLEAENANR